MYREQVPQKLKNARKRTGLTQRDVAKEIGIAQSLLARYETGGLEPNIEILSTLIDFYEISADWLLGTGIRKPKEFNEEYGAIGRGTSIVNYGNMQESKIKNVFK